MARTKPRVDAVVVGFGWTGAIAAKELVDAGLSVVALERGPAYAQADDFATKRMHDGLRYTVGQEFAHPLDRTTLTFRHDPGDTALPMRRIGSFNPSEGYGGSGNTWSGHSFRAQPSDFVIRSHYEEKYGPDIFDDGLTSQDWGVTYEELEPHYAWAEDMMGVSGQAGVIGGETVEGGNPFEGSRSAGYPLPAFERHAAGAKFIEETRAQGLNPFPVPVANASHAHTNAYGVTMNECVVCGHCPSFACAYGAKGSPVNSIHPALMGRDGFEARPHAAVTRVETDPATGLATGVTYVDGAGTETFQPADMVFLAAYAFDNTRLMLLSGIGRPYEVDTGEGVVGRNYSYQILGSVQAFFEDESFNPYVAGGGMGTVIDDYGSDHFDHAAVEGRPFVGGGFIGPFNLSAFPMTYHPTPPGSPAWGEGWKEAVAKWYQGAMGLNVHASVQAHRHNYLDLDPTYRDAYGQPLLRMTFDYRDNERRMLDFLLARGEAVARAMNPAHVAVNGVEGRYDIARYQTTHNVGGTAMGADPATSVVNTWGQSWDAHNVFVLGGSVFPQNTHYNPTLTINALAHRAMRKVVSGYVGNPGPMG